MIVGSARSVEVPNKPMTPAVGRTRVVGEPLDRRGVATTCATMTEELA
jgi:hypothetical protein